MPFFNEVLSSLTSSADILENNFNTAILANVINTAIYKNLIIPLFLLKKQPNAQLFFSIFFHDKRVTVNLFNRLSDAYSPDDFKTVAILALSMPID